MKGQKAPRRKAWERPLHGIARAKQLLAKYDYDPARAPSDLARDEKLENDWDDMLRQIK